MKRFFVIFALLLAAWPAFSQHDTRFARPDFVRTYYNPAFAGMADGPRAQLAGRRQWVGLPGGPGTFFASYDQPLSKINSGLGGGFSVNSIGFFSTVSFRPNYAYHFEFGEDIRLSVGQELGISRWNVSGDWRYYGPGDPLLYSGSSWYLDYSAGLLFSVKGAYAGFAVRHVNRPSVLPTEFGEIFLARNAIAQLGYVHESADDNWSLRSDAMAMYQGPIAFWQLNVSGRYKFITAGVGVDRYKDVLFSLGFQKGWFSVVYNYGLATSYLGSFTTGSHEFMTRAIFPQR